MATSEKSTPARRAVLAAAMLGVLLAALGVAWLLQSTSSRRVRAAAEILARIREEGLQNIWGEHLRINWYLAMEGEQAVRWRAVVIGRSEDGDFLGADVSGADERSRMLYERWRLNGDATNGSYQAFAGTQQTLHLDTDITLRRGSVTVVQHNLGLLARSPAPENYLPEGLLGPVIRQVAADQADAQFKLVFNNTPNPNKVIEYGACRVRHLSRQLRSDRTRVDRVRLSESRARGGHGMTYELDEEGDFLRISDDHGGHWAPASAEEVAKHFKGAAAALQRLIPKELRPGPDASLPGRLEVLRPQLLGPLDEVRVGRDGALG